MKTFHAISLVLAVCVAGCHWSGREQGASQARATTATCATKIEAVPRAAGIGNRESGCVDDARANAHIRLGSRVMTVSTSATICCGFFCYNLRWR